VYTARRFAAPLVVLALSLGAAGSLSTDAFAEDRAPGAAPQVPSEPAPGETPAQIEADFVARYGERVRAASQSRAMGWAAVLAGVVVIGAGAAVARMVLRWRKQSPVLPEASGAKGEAARPDALDERLDAELRAMD